MSAAAFIQEFIWKRPGWHSEIDKATITIYCGFIPVVSGSFEYVAEYLERLEPEPVR